MLAYVYVLHFDTPLEHAQHYIGCTVKLEKRLRAHAIGAGSRLTQELRKQGISWHLASLFCTNRAAMRRIERSIKNCHQGARYCEKCSGPNFSRPDGTTPYPVGAIPFETSSLRIEGGLEPVITVRETNGNEPISICDFILSMMQEAKGQAGFIPIGGTGGLTQSIAKGRVIIGMINGFNVGYMSYGLSMDGKDITIHQTIVDDTYQGLGVGRAMVSYAAKKHPDRNMRCTVKRSLAANEFWKAIGFVELGERKHGTSNQDLIAYYRGINDENHIQVIGGSSERVGTAGIAPIEQGQEETDDAANTRMDSEATD